MCGIFGYFSARGQITGSDLSIAMDRLRHRGPDNSAAVHFHNGSGSIVADLLPTDQYRSVLAHTRLSIIDLSASANQPMCNEDGSVWIVYNGEIYDFRETMNHLREKGHIFKSQSDTEVILHGYEEWGSEVVHRLRGMFAFALYDLRKDRLILARDRLGVKPLKYYFDGKTFIFASELKSLLHIVPGRIDAGSVDKFLTLKYIPSPHTIIDSVRKVSPAEIIELDVGAMRLNASRYWRPVFYPKIKISFAEAKEEFEKRLSEAVSLRTVSDVPIGVYLSGGLDSSAIVAFLRKAGMERINTFTIRFDRPGYDESSYAEQVSRLFQTDHHQFDTPRLTSDGLQDIIRSLDEPFGDPSYIPTYYLSKFTSDHLNVVLSGDGGDEILGGYKRYFIHARSSMLKYLPKLRLNIAGRMRPEIGKKRLLGRLQRIEDALAAGYWDSYIHRLNGFDRSFKRYVMTPEFLASSGDYTITDFVGDSADFGMIEDTMERLIWFDMQSFLPDYILAKTDLALMAHSIEGRNPFVDYKLVEFANLLEPKHKFRGGGKYLLKAVLEKYLPEEIIYRKKMGFSPPIKYWFRENADLLHDIFSDGAFASFDIFDVKRIHEAIEKSKKPDINISEPLWLITVLELWRRAYGI